MTREHYLLPFRLLIQISHRSIERLFAAAPALNQLIPTKRKKIATQIRKSLDILVLKKQLPCLFASYV